MASSTLRQPKYRILHLTDTHLLGDPSARHNGVDTYRNLERTLERIEHLDFDLIALTGDLSEDGSAASYRRLRELVEPWAEQRGARTAYVMGNHDQREGFTQVLGDLRRADDGATTSQQDSAALSPRSSVTFLDGLRIVVLDTSVPGAGYGELGPQQLQWLHEQLSDPAEDGTVLLMHHPPIPAQTVLLQALSLQNPQSLAEVLQNSDVQLILSGHYHHHIAENWMIGSGERLPVLVSAAVTNLVEPLGNPTTEDIRSGAGGTVVELYEDRTHRALPFHVPLPSTGDVLAHLDADTVQRIIAEAGPAGD
ncbi:metallophosphoesterase [Nesterenkonia rhizosphaerae]|uniref:Metallophosphoesterase n=1 Tax=Nesterenkonia rhizosphaerae TaxID=1348272 RepID=A0ABP9FTL9_9MICC